MWKDIKDVVGLLGMFAVAILLVFFFGTFLESVLGNKLRRGQCQEACARLQPAESKIVEDACLCKVDTTWVHVEPLSWRK